MKYTFFSEQEVVSSENVDKAESPLPKGWGKIIYRSLVKDLGPMGGAPYFRKGEWTLRLICHCMYLINIVCVLGSTFMQLMNVIRNSEGDAKAQVVVPPGLKSIRSSIKLQVILNNQRAKTIQYYWVNYNGNHIFYGSVSPGGSATLLT